MGVRTVFWLEGLRDTDTFFGRQCTQISSWTLLVRASYWTKSLGQSLIHSIYMCKERSQNGKIVQKNFKPSLRIEIMMSLLVGFLQTLPAKKGWSKWCKNGLKTRVGWQRMTWLSKRTSSHLLERKLRWVCWLKLFKQDSRIIMVSK